jgi:Icc-related predicted phosphoesterase
MRYKEGQHQYTQQEMTYQALALLARLLRYRISRGRWLDILVTHAPPFGIHDASDVCHTGFRAFLMLAHQCRPKYLIHGHSHTYNQLHAMTTRYQDTWVVNAYPYRVIEIEVPQRKKAGK